MRYLLIIEDVGPAPTASVRRRNLLKWFLRRMGFRSLMDPRPVPESLDVGELWQRVTSDAWGQVDALRRELDERED